MLRAVVAGTKCCATPCTAPCAPSRASMSGEPSTHGGSSAYGAPRAYSPRSGLRPSVGIGWRRCKTCLRRWRQGESAARAPLETLSWLLAAEAAPIRSRSLQTAPCSLLPAPRPLLPASCSLPKTHPRHFCASPPVPLSVVEALIHATDELGMTPLLWAAKRGFADVVEVLLAFGGAHEDLMAAQDAEGSTPLHHAARKAHNDIVTLLLEVRDLPTSPHISPHLPASPRTSPIHPPPSTDQASSPPLLLYRRGLQSMPSTPTRALPFIGRHARTTSTRSSCYSLTAPTPRRATSGGRLPSIMPSLLTTW